MKKKIRNRFTLIELLVVISIIAILAGMLLPGLMMVRAKGKQIKCAGNCHQIGIALNNYIDEYDGVIPYVADALYAPGVTIHYWSENIQTYIKSTDVLVCPGFNKLTAETVGHPRCDYGRNYSHISTKPTMAFTRMQTVSHPSQVMAFLDSKRNNSSHDDSWLLYCPCCSGTTITQMQNVDARHNKTANVSFWDGHSEPLRWAEIQYADNREMFWYH